MAQTQYNRVIRKLVVGFGNLFDDITLVRYNPDNSEAERFIVPLMYATKEYYVRRLEEDYNADKKIQITLPRMSFEMAGMSYDATRKLNTNWKQFGTSNGEMSSQYNPVPYNFDFNLYLYVRNVEDATQLIEHILPFFTPDYTIKLNLIPELGIIKEVPIVLNSTSHEIQYEGNRESETRTIIWTLNFTVKGFIFGAISPQGGIIKHSIVSIYEDITSDQIVDFNINQTTGVGDYQIGEVVYQGFTYNTATATAKVITWGNSVLQLTDINGDFISTQPIYGLTSSANYSFTSTNIIPNKYAQIDAYANSPVTVKMDYSTFTMDNSNTEITMDGVNVPTTSVTESQ
jgi:hypothetical protein